jgi:hypothetical protein
MPPTPDRPRKPAVPARGGQHPLSPKQVPAKPVSKPAPKPVANRPIPPAKPVPLPLPLPEETPPPTEASKTGPKPRRRDVHISVPVWWGIVLGVGMALILCFEIGYTLGERRGAQRRPAEPTGVAVIKPEEARQKPAAANPSANVTPPPATPKEVVKPAPVVTPKKSPPSTPPAEEETTRPVEATKPMEPAVALKFDKDILPIFQSKCFKCHGAVSKRGGLDLRSIGSIVRGGNSGPGMKPGHPDESPLWQSVKTGEMPPPKNPQLTPDEKQLILAWIAGGGK